MELDKLELHTTQMLLSVLTLQGYLSTPVRWEDQTLLEAMIFQEGTHELNTSCKQHLPKIPFR